MKKILRLFIPLLLVITLVGCNKESPDSKIVVEFNESAYTPVSLQASDLAAKQENKENFVLFIYRDGCTACENFRPYLEEVMYIFQVLIYSIEISSNENYTYLMENVKDLKYTPTIVIFNQGKQYKKADPVSRKSAFSSSDGFASYLFNYVTTSND